MQSRSVSLASNCRTRLFSRIIYAGFRPCRRVTFVSAKVTKTISARARPCWIPPPPYRIKMAQELAPLKQPSPRSRFGTAAPPCTKAWNHSRNKPTFKTGDPTNSILLLATNSCGLEREASPFPVKFSLTLEINVHFLGSAAFTG